MKTSSLHRKIEPATLSETNGGVLMLNRSLLLAILLLCTAFSFAGEPESTPGDGCLCGTIYDHNNISIANYPSDTTLEHTEVQRFAPTHYPWRVDAVCVALRQLIGSLNTDLSYEVVMFADDGPSGAPGTELASLPDTASGIDTSLQFFSTETRGSFPWVNSGAVYIGIRWSPSADHDITVPRDRSVSSHKTYFQSDDSGWIVLWDGASLIRVRGPKNDPIPARVVRPDSTELVGDLRLWLRGDDLTPSYITGDEVSLWPDASGAAHDAVALNGNRINPLFRLADLPAVRFRSNESRDELMRSTGLFGGASPTDLTIVTAYKTSLADSKMRPVGFGAFGDGSTADNFNLATDPSIRKDNESITGYGVIHRFYYFVRSATMDSSAATLNEWFDGLEALSSNEIFTVATDDFYLGDLKTADTDRSVNIAETIVFDRALTTAERGGVEGYMGAKYRSRLYHRHEEGVAGLAADSVLDHSFHDNHGTAVALSIANPVYSTDVAMSTVPLTGSTNAVSLDFERDNLNRVEVPHSWLLDLDVLAGQLTIEAWVRLETLSEGGDGPEDRQYVVWKADSGAVEASSGSYGFLAQAGDLADLATVGAGTHNSLMFWVEGGYEHAAVISSLTITDTAWHHIAVTFDPDTDSVQFVLDQAVETVTGVTVTPQGNEYDLIIGGHYTAGAIDPTFDGLMDELRITGAALPVEQLLSALDLESIFSDGFESGDTTAWSTTVQ